MALINYVEPFDPAGMFAGIGFLIVSLTFAYILYRFYVKFCDWLDVAINKDMKYVILEEKHLDKVAKAKGIDLEEELLKREVIKKRKKSFRKKVEEKVFEEMFGKEKKGN